ncbi:uncharacterized protein B0H18DRAFT_633015 [Fomitopsis serialis]|uniref:uncharacterized protein n=1 Tax=Fomitopsis serialis TaxID=139415 RepID=UPI0020086DFA|nr:uncharacterized protein B0H18DRAFT_633015 [Neoantrodia serialis]KAH9919539.1 hypothetical protein B0H18DRAFT_633015 [Neoantrodia serialis]
MFLLFMRRALVGASLVMMTLPIVSAQDSTVLHRADTMTALTTPPSSMVTSNPRPSATLNDGSSVSISCLSQSDGDDCIVVAGGETETMAEDSRLGPAHTMSLTSSSTLAASNQSSNFAPMDSTFPFSGPTWSILSTTVSQTSPATPETTEIGLSMISDPSMGPHPTSSSDAASVPSLYSSLVASTTMPTRTGTDASFVTSVGPHETEALTPAPTKSRPQTWLIVLSIGCAVVTLALVALVVRCLWRRRARSLVDGSVMPLDGDVDEKPCLSARQLAMSMSSLADAKHRLRTPSIICAGDRGSVIDILPPERLLLSENDTKIAGTTGMQYWMLSNGVNGRLSIDPAAHTLLDPPAVADAAYRDTLSRRLSTTASGQLSLDHVEVVDPSAGVLLPSIQPPGEWSCLHHNLAPLPDHLSQQGRRPVLSALTPSAAGVRPARPLPPTPTPTLPFTHVSQPLPVVFPAHQYNNHFPPELGTHISSAQQPSGPSPTQWAMIHHGAFVATFPGRTPRRRAEDGGVRLAGGLPRWQRGQGGAQGEESNARGSSGSAGGYSDETLPPEYGAY